MADGNFGGGGSVTWEINTDDVKNKPEKMVSRPHDMKPKGWKQAGTDYDGEEVPGNRFVVRLKVPKDMDPTLFVRMLGQLEPRDGYVQFALAPEKDQKQVRILWGVGVPSEVEARTLVATSGTGV